MPNLSKSKILAYRQCPKRLWLEIHKPELRDDSASEAVFAIGNQVGEVARQVFDPHGNGAFIDINALGHSEAIRQSATLLTEGAGPVFEAGIASNRHHPQPGMQCSWCQFKNECKAWLPGMTVEEIHRQRAA